MRSQEVQKVHFFYVHEAPDLILEPTLAGETSSRTIFYVDVGFLVNTIEISCDHESSKLLRSWPYRPYRSPIPHTVSQPDSCRPFLHSGARAPGFPPDGEPFPAFYRALLSQGAAPPGRLVWRLCRGVGRGCRHGAACGGVKPYLTHV